MATNNNKPNVWWQYIDDILTIWEYDQEFVNLFLQQIYLFHTTYKFMAEMSTEHVTFSDTIRWHATHRALSWHTVVCHM